jgi:hypothetical protein
VVADAIEKALARTVRRAGGLQWVAGLADAVAACRAQGSLHPLEVVAASLEPSKATGVGGAFLDAAWSLAATPATAGGSSRDLDALVKAGLERMVEKLCVGPLEPDLVPTIFSAATELSAYVERCVSEVQLDNMTRQMTRTGCTGKVRAPRTRLARPGTKELLHEPLA